MNNCHINVFEVISQDKMFESQTSDSCCLIVNHQETWQMNRSFVCGGSLNVKHQDSFQIDYLKVFTLVFRQGVGNESMR